MFDAEPNLVASNLNNGDSDVVPNDDTFAYLAGDDDHRLFLIGGQALPSLAMMQ